MGYTPTMDIEAEAKKLLLENRRTTDGNQYTIPSADHYPYQWLWDSCFHAIVLARYDMESAKAEIQSLLSKQFSNGLVPHIIYWTPGILHLFHWGTDGTSSLTQPPMLAYAAWEIHRREPDTSFLASIFPALVAYYNYLLSERDPHGHHLASIISPDESGEDNSPRFDIPLGVPPAVSLKDHLAKRTELVDRNRECDFDAGRCMRDFFWVKDVLFNAVLADSVGQLYPAVSVLSFYTDFANPLKTVYSWNKSFPPAKDYFLAGALPIYIGFASEFKEIREKNPNLNFDVSRLPQLKDSKNKITFGKMRAVAVLKTSRNISAAVSRIYLLTDKNAGLLWSAKTGLPSARRDLLFTDQTNPARAIFDQSALWARGWPDPSPSATSAIFQRMVEAVVTGRLSVSEAVGQANTELSALIGR